MADPDDKATQLVSGAGLDDATRVVSAQAGTGGAAAASASSVLPVGTRVAEFEIIGLIGQGGFGVVYEAHDHTLERTVALKEYLPSALATRAGDGSIVPLSERQRETFDLGMRSFINEARLLAQFDHPSLVKVYRFWEERGTTFMVMPYYRGQTLRDALAAAGSGVDEAWLRGVVDGVTQALSVMHAAQCYHRDIAPDNIMILEGSGRPVVLDFGAARRVITDKTQAITVILKPGYAPIEQYAEMPDMTQGAWTDVYALAAVMHVAVAGRVPPPSVSRILSDSYALLAQDAELSQRYSAQLLMAIDRGLAVRPQDRPQSMAQFRELLGLAGGAGDGAQDATRILSPQPARAGAAPARRKLLPGLVLLALLATAAGGLWWYLNRDALAPQADQAPVAVAEPDVAVADEPAEPLPAAEPPLQADAADELEPAAAVEPAAPPSQVLTEALPPAAPTEPATEVAEPGAMEAPPPPAAPAQAEAPPPPPPAARTASESLDALALGAASDFQVSAQAGKAQVTIGQDQLDFQVSSNRKGFVYVFLLDSENALYLLFPNALDKRNEIARGETLKLPRPAWAMASGGPAGVNRFAVLVSQFERDFTQSGVLSGGVFAEFPTSVLAALERAREGERTPLLGNAICPAGSDCTDAYGVAYFDITEHD